MQDPGFRSGLIAWAIGFFMACVIEQIKIVFSFPEKLKTLTNQQGIYGTLWEEYQKYHTADPDLDLEKRFPEISKMVKSASAVHCFNFISRYWMCKKIPSLIKDIEMLQSLLSLRIGVAAAGKTQMTVGGQVHLSMPPVEKKEVSKNRMDAALLVPAKAEGVFMDAAVMHSWNVDVEAPAHSSNVNLLGCALTHDAPPLVPVPRRSKVAGMRAKKSRKHALMAIVQKAPAHAESGSESESESESEVENDVPKHAWSATEQKEAPAHKLTAHAVWELEASEAAPAHAVSELEAQAVPTQAVSEVEVDATNRGFYSRFMEILEHINIDLTGRRQLASLEDLAKEIRRTIPLIKKRVNSTSVVETWIKRLREVLQKADEMNEQYKGRFIYHPKVRKMISDLISEINRLLKWGQVIITLACFNN